MSIIGKHKLPKKMAIEYISDIGKAAFELQHFSDRELFDAMTFMRQVNPELFDFVTKVITLKLDSK